MKFVLALCVVAFMVAYVSAAAAPELDPVEAEKAAAPAGVVPKEGGKLQKRGLYGWGGWGYGPGWGWGGGWAGPAYYGGWGYPAAYGWGWGSGWGGFYF